MVFILRIVVCLGLVVLPAALAIRDWKYHDRRTRRHHQLTRYILIAWFPFAAANAILVGVGQWEQEELLEKVDDLVRGKNMQLSQNEKLISQTHKLQASITEYQSDLREKEARIKELELSAKMASRGVTSMYDYNGAKRETAGGKITLSTGHEFEIFPRLKALEKARDYYTLIDLCEEQIKKTPDWLTPYLFLGVAYANIGSRDKAITNLRYVAENAPGDPDYAQAETFLQKLKSGP